MKYIYVILSIFLFNLTCFSQRNIDSLILKSIEKKETNYFRLQKCFTKVRFSKDELNLLLMESKKHNYLLGEVYANNTKGRFYRNITEYDNAIKSYQKALELSRKIKSKEAEIVILNQLGVVYRRQDKIRVALNFHQSVLDLILKIEESSQDIEKSKSIAINSIGNIYLTLKQYEKALEKFEESIALQKELNDKRGLAINHQNIGFAYKNIGDLSLALKNYRKSLKFNEENNDDLGIVICHNHISNILILQNKYEEAYNYINEIIDSAKEIGNRYYLSEVYNTLGLVLLKLDKIDESEEYLNKALEIGEQNNIPSSLILSYLHLSELNKKKENYKLALELYQKSKEIEKKIFNTKNIRYVNSLINKYDSEVSINKIKSLAKENEIARLKLFRNRNLLIITLVSIALFAVLLYAMYRHRLLKNDKKVIQLEQEALRIQMNPHFVFNALNSIKLYIINNEQKNAVYYLNKFSKLIRNILESTNVKEVTLTEELKTMNLYMSIENIRFSNEISYEEDISFSLNLDTIKVPPLVLQPFLENSIWHGLSSKKGEKKIKLLVRKIADEFIQIEIVDNGIGREAAFKIKESKSLKRRSIGIDLTKERLQNFSAQFQNNYLLNYTDLLDEEGNVSGTKVTLQIPIV